MEIKSISIDELKPYTQNPRVISENAVNSIADSLREFGWQQPIVIDKTNTIIVGHTRMLAAKKMGMQEVPVKIVDELSEEQINAYRILDNKLNELTTWDQGLLENELSKIDSSILNNFEDLFLMPDLSQNNEDLNFLNDFTSTEQTVPNATLEENLEKMVDLTFVMRPDDKQMIISALRNIQVQNGLENITQSLIKICKEFHHH